jgi:hypothetical protein
MRSRQSTLRTAPGLCKNCRCNLVATVIHIQSPRSQIYRLYIYIYIYTCSSQYKEIGRPKEINEIETAVNVMCQGNISACQMIVTPDLSNNVLLLCCFLTHAQPIRPREWRQHFPTSCQQRTLLSTKFTPKQEHLHQKKANYSSLSIHYNGPINL